MYQDILEGYRRVGGWIAAIVVMVSIDLLRGFIGLLNSIALLGDVRIQYAMSVSFWAKAAIIFVVLLSILRLVAFAYFLACVLKRNKKHSTYAIFSIPALYAVAFIFLNIAFANMPKGSGQTISSPMSTLFLSLIYLIVAAACWVRYLQNSKRARVYFADEQDYEIMLQEASLTTTSVPSQTSSELPQPEPASTLPSFDHAPQQDPDVTPPANLP